MTTGDYSPPAPFNPNPPTDFLWPSPVIYSPQGHYHLIGGCKDLSRGAQVPGPVLVVKD